MRIVHIAYPRINFTDANAWLNLIGFFTGILKEQALNHEVMSIHCLRTDEVLFRDGVEYHFVKQTFLHYLFPVRLHDYVRKLSPNIVIIHGLHFGWQILWLRFQLARSCKIFVQHHAEKPKRFPKNIIQRFADKFIEGYFFTSRLLAASWVGAGQIESINKVYEVAAGSSTFHLLDKSNSREILQLPIEDIIYIWVGILDQNKDPITLVNAFNKFAKNNNSTRLYVVFNGGELENQIRELVRGSTYITLVGSIEHSKLQHWFNSADFVISTSHYESSGIAVCEGMSCGCIPILTEIPSFKQFTNDGSIGLHFPAGNAEKLFQALNKSLEIDRETQRQLTLRQFETSLSFKAIANKMSTVIEA